MTTQQKKEMTFGSVGLIFVSVCMVYLLNAVGSIRDARAGDNQLIHCNITEIDNLKCRDQEYREDLKLLVEEVKKITRTVDRIEHGVKILQARETYKNAND